MRTYDKQARTSSLVKSVPVTLALNKLQASPDPVALGPGAVAVPVRDEPVARGVPVAVTVRVTARDDSSGSVPFSCRRRRRGSSSSAEVDAAWRATSCGGGGERRCFSRSRIAKAGAAAAAAAARAKAKAFMMVGGVWMDETSDGWVAGSEGEEGGSRRAFELQAQSTPAHAVGLFGG